MVYCAIGMTVFIGIGSFAVDVGRVQTAKAELQSTTDAAARYAAMAMRSMSSNSTSAAAANAQAVFAQNPVDGSTAPFNSATDMQLGIWSPATKTFTPASVSAGANAVRLNTKLTLGDADRPLTLASLIGKTVTVRASAIAMMSGSTANTWVNAKGNPWLAGMPSGSVSQSFRNNPNQWDYAGSGPNNASSPAMIGMSSASITPGQTIMFDSVTGTSSFGGGSSSPDGDSSKLVTLGSPSFNNYTYFNSPMNGMSNIKAPINSMMAVFLSDDQPDATAAPTPLDFSTATSRDFTSLSPQLKQVFSSATAAIRTARRSSSSCRPARRGCSSARWTAGSGTTTPAATPRRSTRRTACRR